LDYATIVFSIYILFIVTTAITTFLHELGHAIPALIFTWEKVSIYLGTYGDNEKSRNIRLSSRLTLYFLPNPLKWRRGMVQHSIGEQEFGKRLVITLLGPLMSLIIAVIALWTVFSFDMHGFLKVFAIVFFCSALIDLRNIYPDKTPIALADGSHTYCDGYRLKRLLETRKEKADYFAASELYDAQNYSDAIKLFEKVRAEWISPEMLTVILNAYSKLGEYVKAKEFYGQVINQPDFLSDSNVLCNVGYILSQLNEHEEAMDFYNKSITLNENNIYSISNRGFTFNVFAQYHDALIDFNRVLTIDPEFDTAYSNRSFTYIKFGMLDEALNDINTTIKLNDKNAYAYRNLGIYYMELGEYNKAIEQLRFAQKLDPNTHMINDYIKTVNDKLGLVV
jgi:Tfp pilus assembly protein PilF